LLLGRENNAIQTPKYKAVDEEKMLRLEMLILACDA